MTDEKKREIYRGHIGECLRYLANSLPKGLPATVQAYKQMAEFCGISVRTAIGWVNNTNPLPVGGKFIKLRCYLDLAGCKVIELERMPKGRRNFSDLIALGFLSPQQAIELLGYKDPSSLYAVLLGKDNASKEKDSIMWDAWKQKKEEIEQKKAQLREQYNLDIPAVATAAITNVKPVVASAQINNGKLTNNQSAILKIMDGLLVMMNYEPLDKFAQNLPQSSAKTILQLSANLSNLSSRLINKNQGKGEKDA